MHERLQHGDEHLPLPEQRDLLGGRPLNPDDDIGLAVEHDRVRNHLEAGLRVGRVEERRAVSRTGLDEKLDTGGSEP